MGGRQVAWRLWYEALAVRLRKPEWAFMNYGYAPLDPRPAPVALEARDEADRLSIQLYEHALANADLGGADVLEVGSGRGGGASYVNRYHRPRSMTGLDFSRSAVSLCNRSRREPGLVFVHGDAQAMPFPDESFDAVVNVESSHCYDSMEAFLAEVHRVLRPGGAFFWADLRDRGDIDALHGHFGATALTLQDSGEITDAVLLALRLDNDRKSDLIDTWVPRAVRRPFRRFAGIEGSRTYARFEAGELRYLTAHLTKEGPR